MTFHYSIPEISFEFENFVKNRQSGFTLKNYKINQEKFEEIANKNFEGVINSVFEVFLSKYNFIIGHYFRHFYHILILLDEYESIDHKGARDKIQKYVGFIQAQMSTPEMFLLYYNCLKFPKFRNLLVKYNILENLNKEDLLDVSHANFIPEILLKSKEI